MGKGEGPARVGKGAEGWGSRQGGGRRLERRRWRVGRRQVADGRWPGTENEAPAAGRLGEEARGMFSPKMDVGCPFIGRRG